MSGLVPGSGADRARVLLKRPGAWLESRGANYVLRQGPDRRSRVVLMIDETAFRALVERPGLAARPAGGWTMRRVLELPVAEAAGRPGVIEGEAVLVEIDGRLARRRANLGESPLAWLARRKNADGQAWLTPAEVAAGERLRHDAETAGRGAGVTMRWDGLPRHGSGTGVDLGPGDRAVTAARRVQRALDSAGPVYRPILRTICIEGSALQMAERELGLRRRRGKLVLKEGLARLAVHYRIG